MKHFYAHCQFEYANIVSKIGDGDVVHVRPGITFVFTSRITLPLTYGEAVVIELNSLE